MASGFTAGSIGLPVHNVESFSRNRSDAGPPYTMTPVRPFPRGRASSKAEAALSYHSRVGGTTWIGARWPGTAAMPAAAASAVAAASANANR